MKRIVCVTLVLLLVLSGCTSELEKLMGTWEFTTNRSDLVLERIAAESPELANFVRLERFPVIVQVRLYADSTYQVEVDRQSVEAAVAAIQPSLEDALWRYLQQLSPDVEALLQELGITRQELMAEAFGNTFAQELIVAMNLRREGCFQVEKGKLYLLEEPEGERGDYHCICVEEDTLTLTPGAYAQKETGEYYASVLPLTLYRDPVSP